ncbi:hypothetical protein SMMN14_07095 [Sphaerulina musiva]
MRERNTGVAKALYESDTTLLLTGEVRPDFLATGLAVIGVERPETLGALDPSVDGELIKAVVQANQDVDVGEAITKESRSAIGPFEPSLSCCNAQRYLQGRVSRNIFVDLQDMGLPA